MPSTFTRRIRLVLFLFVSTSLLAGGGCAALLQPRKQDRNADDGRMKVTLAQVERAQRDAEADPMIRSVSNYANLVSAYSVANPDWDSAPHVQRIEKLADQCAGEAKGAFDRGQIDDIHVAARIAAHDVPGARAIYRKRFETRFTKDAFFGYLRLIKELNGGVAGVTSECKEWYGSATEQERRYDIAGQCEKMLQTREDDGLGWLPPDDHVKVKEEFVIRSAEIQLISAKDDRERARQEGRYISANYRGLVDIRVQTQCPRVVYLAGSATARAALGQKIPVDPTSAPNVTHVIQVQADHLLWLLDETDHRIAVARMGVWDNGLLVTRNCKGIVSMR
jgi:hypothetical protein